MPSPAERQIRYTQHRGDDQSSGVDVQKGLLTTPENLLPIEADRLDALVI